MPGWAPGRFALALRDHGAQLNDQGADCLFCSRKGLKSWRSSHNRCSWGLFAFVAPLFFWEASSKVTWEKEKGKPGKQRG